MLNNVCSLSIPNHISFSTHHLVLRVDSSDFNNGNSAALSTPRPQSLVCVLFYYRNFSKHVLSFNLKDLMFCVCRQIFDDVFPYPFQHTKHNSHLLFTCTQYFNHFNIWSRETKSFPHIYEYCLSLIKNHFQLNFSAAISLSSSLICNTTSPLKRNNFFFSLFDTWKPCRKHVRIIFESWRWLHRLELYSHAEQMLSGRCAITTTSRHRNIIWIRRNPVRHFVPTVPSITQRLCLWVSNTFVEHDGISRWVAQRH